ncbi:hypothetical protein GCM10020331_080580 [Ectobacillus funiculus]
MPTQTAGVTITEEATAATSEILTPEALAFIKSLHRKFNGRRKELLALRKEKAGANQRWRAS